MARGSDAKILARKREMQKKLRASEWWRGIGKQSLTYGMAETVLGRLHDADEDVQKNALRGRLKHLKRLGIPLDSSPGRGAKVRYREEQYWQWALCLELAEFGLDPTVAAEFIEREWTELLPKFEKARVSADQFLFLVITPNLMSAIWNPRLKPFDYRCISASSATKSDLARLGSRRAIVINISSLTQTMGRLELAYSSKEGPDGDRS